MTTLQERLRIFRLRHSTRFLNGYVEFLLDDAQAMQEEIGSLRGQCEYYVEIIDRLNDTIKDQEIQIKNMEFWYNLDPITAAELKAERLNEGDEYC